MRWTCVLKTQWHFSPGWKWVIFMFQLNRSIISESNWIALVTCSRYLNLCCSFFPMHNIYLSTSGENNIRRRKKKKKTKTPNQIKPAGLSQNLVAASLISDVLFINHLHLHQIVYAQISSINSKRTISFYLCNTMDYCGAH